MNAVYADDCERCACHMIMTLMRNASPPPTREGNMSKLL